jgi:hypothetical protein
MKQLVNIIKKALISALVGLFSGLFLGLVIWAITLLVSSSDFQMPPREVAAFLGMGFGTVLGAIFGGIVGLKEK